MNRLLTALSEYGADVKGTLNRFLGDEELYITCLNLYLKDHHFQNLESAIKDRNTSSAFDHAHALKGTTSNLGLTPLYKAISAVVEALRAEDIEQATALYPALDSERERVFKLIENNKDA